MSFSAVFRLIFVELLWIVNVIIFLTLAGTAFFRWPGQAKAFRSGDVKIFPTFTRKPGMKEP